jgi:hypothetical protein
MRKEMENENENQDKIVVKDSMKEDERVASGDIFRYFRFGLFAILMLLLLVATLQFYFSALDAISTLFTYEYHSLVHAGFAACIIAVVIYLLRVVIVNEK